MPTEPPLKLSQMESAIARSIFNNVLIERTGPSVVTIATGSVGADDGASLIEVVAPIPVDITGSGAGGLTS